MHPFASYILRSYYQATGWNEDNLYSNLTRSSTAILDFPVPRGVHFHISKSPNPWFKTTYSMNALPSLNGSLGYIYTSCDLAIPGSHNVPFRDLIDRYKVYDQPRRPEEKEEVWLTGKRVDTRDYLLYGRYYIPTARLDAVYSTRISRTLQAVVAAISDPSLAPARSSDAGPSMGMSNLMLSLQHDTGRWCTEYSWSADDGMWGARVLHNFGRLAGEEDLRERRGREKRVDEEEAMEGGLKGRFSAGAEVYFSAKEKSGGVSTGIRFTTLPDATPPSAQLTSPSGAAASSNAPFSQPPTTLTAIFNPMMGHLSTAYAAQVSRDLSLCTRFNFNMYSYESEWTMGAEWWIRNKKGKETEGPASVDHVGSWNGANDEVQGVVKARISTNSDISLMWEGRLRNILVSLGVVSDLINRSKPIRAIGLEIAYFGSE